jgi:ubiquinone/menaquinone biosynthesis C-methylase UbiE
MSDSDEEGPSPNWELLKETLSPSAYAELRSHLDNTADSNKNPTLLNRQEEVMLNSVFKEQSYWNQRFMEEEEYDWLVKTSQISEYIVPHINMNDRILVVGCGNSSFSVELYNMGYKNIVNIDFSDVLINKMKEKYQNLPEMQWLVMDMMDLSAFKDGEFDCVIDKASMDALVTDEGDVWHPSESAVLSVDKYLKEVSRVLGDHKYFLQITFSQPHFRTKYLMGLRSPAATAVDASPYQSATGYAPSFQWNVEYNTVTIEKGSFDNFIYKMRKEPRKTN